MGKVFQKKSKQPVIPKDIYPKYMAMGTWKLKKYKTKGK